MATAVPARLSAAEGRRFGLTVGIAFLVLGGVSRWRGHDVAPLVLWALGGGLTLLGLAVPTRLGPLFRAWMGLAHLLSRVTTPIFMGLVYFVVIMPIGLLMRLFGRNPMVHRPAAGSYWVRRQPPPEGAGGPERMQRQF